MDREQAVTKKKKTDRYMEVERIKQQTTQLQRKGTNLVGNLISNGDYVEQIEPTPLIVEEMDDIEGEAADIFSQVKKRKKMK